MSHQHRFCESIRFHPSQLHGSIFPACGHTHTAHSTAIVCLQGPVRLCCGQGVVKDISLTRASGIKHGDPLSPPIFVMTCSVLVSIMQQISRDIHVLFYADDLFLYRPQPPSTVCAVLPWIFEALQVYGVYLGLRMNLGKSAFLIKGTWTPRYLEALNSFGIHVNQKVRYLGVLVGHVSSDEAYAPLIARALHRAHFMRTLQLSHEERIALFQERVLPLLIFPARAYFPSDMVVAKVTKVYKVALCLNSSGLALPIVAHEPAKGGNNMPPPWTFLCGSTRRHASRRYTSPMQCPGCPGPTCVTGPERMEWN